MHLQDVIHLQKQLVPTLANTASCVYLKDFSKQVGRMAFPAITHV